MPHEFYRARSEKYDEGKLTVVEVCTTFGHTEDCWTIAVLGSDQHYMLHDFKILSRVEKTAATLSLQAAE
jgi:hypothetical protein